MRRAVGGVMLLALAGCGDGAVTYVCVPACLAGYHCVESGCVSDSDGEPPPDAAVGVDIGGAFGCVPQCAGTTPVCSPQRTCVACLVDADCAPGMICQRGACVPGCGGDERCKGGGRPATSACCGGACADTAVDLANCGACGHACAFAHAAASCAAGTCALGACDDRWGDCDQAAPNGCEIDLGRDPRNCRGCGHACTFAHGVGACADGCYLAACVFGWDDCNGDSLDGCETSVAGDAKNCGGCGSACPAIPNAITSCVNAACAVTCMPGWGNCDGAAPNGCEANLATDAANCSACGAPCPQGQVCKGSVCTCPQCANAFPNATSRCINNQCVFDQCKAGWANCDQNNANGCEANLQTSATDCGACGKACGGNTPVCQGGACGATGVSCAAILVANKAAKDGVYTLDPDGAGPIQPFAVWCDMTTDGGGWTVCYNHQVADVEEMTESTVAHMSTHYGMVGDASEFGADCRGTGHALQPKQVRFSGGGGQRWVQFENPPDQVHEFFFAGNRAAAMVTVTTWASAGKTFTRQLCNHDCPMFAYGTNNINQVANGTNSGTCFEHNSKGMDSNHHWAFWGNCDGSYVEGSNQGAGGPAPDQPRAGVARVMLR